MIKCLHDYNNMGKKVHISFLHQRKESQLETSEKSKYVKKIIIQIWSNINWSIVLSYWWRIRKDNPLVLSAEVSLYWALQGCWRWACALISVQPEKQNQEEFQIKRHTARVMQAWGLARPIQNTKGWPSRRAAGTPGWVWNFCPKVEFHCQGASAPLLRPFTWLIQAHRDYLWQSLLKVNRLRL